MSDNARQQLITFADDKIALRSVTFFKTRPGDYGEGDVFIGVSVPVIRRLAKQNTHLDFSALEKLLRDPIHECRMLALLILVEQYRGGDRQARQSIVRFYLDHADMANNWDLVDCSAPGIVGAYCLESDTVQPLYDLIVSDNLWRQRIAIVANWTLIRRDIFSHIFALVDVVIDHDHDLIQKAAGWMLREVGKRDEQKLESFLQKRYQLMPRTMLRYAIERLPQGRRRDYLAGRI